MLPCLAGVAGVTGVFVPASSNAPCMVSLTLAGAACPCGSNTGETVTAAIRRISDVVYQKEIHLRQVRHACRSYACAMPVGRMDARVLYLTCPHALCIQSAPTA